MNSHVISSKARRAPQNQAQSLHTGTRHLSGLGAGGFVLLALLAVEERFCMRVPRPVCVDLHKAGRPTIMGARTNEAWAVICCLHAPSPATYLCQVVRLRVLNA